MKKLVIIPGGFHPFHAGHKALYDAAREAFPSADVYIAATADTSTRPFPFDVKKKLARIAGVDGHRFIQVKSPFRAEEITQMYDPNDTQLIFVRSEKDQEQQPRAGGVKKDGSPSYLQPYKRNGLQPMNKHGYLAYLPTVQFGPGMTSATEIRGKWPGMDQEQKTRLVQQLYPDTLQKPKLADVIVQMLDHVMGESMSEIAPALAAIGGRIAGGAIAGELGLGATGTSIARGVGGAIASNLAGDTNEGANGAQASLMGAPAGEGVTGMTPVTMPMANGPDRKKKGVRMGVEFDEAWLVNDPDAGHQIVPDGGMGTWDEASLVSNLAGKFADMVNMVKNKNYKSLQYVLYQGGVVKSMVDALAQYEKFMEKQGRRPIAKGREIDLGDYVNEKSVSEELDKSGNPMYKNQEVYMVVHNGKEVAFYKPADMKHAYRDAEDLVKQFGGEAHVRKVVREEKRTCPECSGEMWPLSMLAEKQDACYYKVKSRYKVWPSAYASGALVQCRKKGAANWGNKDKK